MTAALAQVARQTPVWSRQRRDGIDRRTRAARRWAELRAAMVAELRHEPSQAEAALLNAAADVALAAEVMRARMLVDGAADPEEVIRAGSELRRLRRSLGLDGNGNVEPAADRLAEDREAGLI
jgi:hypothetical protein